MISRLTRYLGIADPARAGLTPRGIALGMHATAGVAWTHLSGLHVLYRGVDAVDYTLPVGVAEEGASTVANFPTYPFAASTTYKFGLRAISPGGVEEGNTNLVQTIITDGDGVPILPTPNAPTQLMVFPRAGGKFAVSWRYRSEGQQVQPAAYAVYHDNGTGTMDYVTPLAVVTSLGYFTTVAYAHGTAVKFGVRARSAAGSEERNTTVRTATADAEGPAALEAPTVMPGSETT